MEPLLAPGAERDEERRGDTAARAVAPLGSPVVVVVPLPETVFIDRRVWPGGGRVAVVADIGKLCYGVYVVTLYELPGPRKRVERCELEQRKIGKKMRTSKYAVKTRPLSCPAKTYGIKLGQRPDHLPFMESALRRP